MVFSCPPLSFSTSFKRRKKVTKLPTTCDILAAFTCQRWQVSSCPAGLFVLLWCSSPERRKPYGWGVAPYQSGPSRGTGTGEGTAVERPLEHPSETLSKWSYLWCEEDVGESVTSQTHRNRVEFQSIECKSVIILWRDWCGSWYVDLKPLPYQYGFHKGW